MRLVLMGTGPFAVPSFQALLEHGDEIAAVVVRPPVANARAKEPPPASPVLLWANERGLSVSTPASINDAETIEWLASLGADLLVVCDYGQILSRDALAATRLGGINLHGSLLPRHRGAAPVQWSILSGDQRAGVSVIHMTPALDGGPVLQTAETEIGRCENAGELEARLSQIGTRCTIAAVEQLSGTESVVGIDQDKTLATKAPRLSKSDGELHFGYPAQWIDRQIRGLQPWPGAFGNLVLSDGKQLRLIVLRARLLEADLSTLSELQTIQPGELLYGKQLIAVATILSEYDLGSLCVVAKPGLLVLEQLQPAGKRAMSAEEFMRGYSRHEKLFFHVPDTPHSLLEKMIASQI